MKLLKVFGYILITISLISGLFLYIVSFGLWADWLGFWGYIVAFLFAPDLILMIKRIIDYGFTDWYYLLVIGSTIVFWLGSFLIGKAKEG